MRVALDTNRVLDLWRSDADLAERLAHCEQVWLPLIVLGELRTGFYLGPTEPREELKLRHLLAKPTVGVLLPDENTADMYARIYAQLRRAGTPVPTNDLWIAALVLQHDLPLMTRDRHFARIPQLPLL